MTEFCFLVLLLNDISLFWLFSLIFPFPLSIPHFLHTTSFGRFRPCFQAAASSPVRLPSSSSASLRCGSRHGRAFLHGWCWLRFIFLSFPCSFLPFLLLFTDLLCLSLLHWCVVYCWFSRWLLRGSVRHYVLAVQVSACLFCLCVDICLWGVCWNGWVLLDRMVACYRVLCFDFFAFCHLCMCMLHAVRRRLI